MKILGIFFLSLTMSAAFGVQPLQKPTPGFNNDELKHMMRTAHTSEQYEQLAAYFEHRATDFETKAAQKQRELDDLLAYRYHPKTYAIQVDTARNWMDYFRKEINTCSERAKEYRLYASTGVPANQSHGAGQP